MISVGFENFLAFLSLCVRSERVKHSFHNNWRFGSSVYFKSDWFAVVGSFDYPLAICHWIVLYTVYVKYIFVTVSCSVLLLLCVFRIQLSNGPSYDIICMLTLLRDTDHIWHDLLLGQAHTYYTSWFYVCKVVSYISWLHDEAFVYRFSV